MANTISLPSDVYMLLQERAEQQHTSPDVLAEMAVRRYLGAAEQHWRTSFDELLARIHLRTAAFESDEIEADITAASEEVYDHKITIIGLD